VWRNCCYRLTETGLLIDDVRYSWEEQYLASTKILGRLIKIAVRLGTQDIRDHWRLYQMNITDDYTGDSYHFFPDQWLIAGKKQEFPGTLASSRIR